MADSSPNPCFPHWAATPSTEVVSPPSGRGPSGEVKWGAILTQTQGGVVRVTREEEGGPVIGVGGPRVLLYHGHRLTQRFVLGQTRPQLLVEGHHERRGT